MSFFADLLGNAALSGAKIAGDLSEQEQAIARQENESRLALDRAKAVEALREERARAAEIAKRERTSSQMAAVEQQAPTITRARELVSAQQRAPSVDGNVLDVIKSRLSPEQIEKFYGVDNSPVAKLDDKLSVARKGGMYEAEDMLSAARKETVAAMIEARKEREAAAKAARDERKDDQRDRQLDISASKGAGGESSKANRVHSTYTDGEGRQVAVMGSGETKVLSERSFSFNKALAGTIASMTKNDRAFARLTDAEKRSRAEDILKSAGLSPESAAQAGKPAAPPAAGKPTTRPPLSSFNK